VPQARAEGRARSASKPAPWLSGSSPFEERRRISADSDDGSSRQKQPLRRQQRLKRPRRSAGARVIAAELLRQFLGAVHDAITALDPRLGRDAPASLARDLESTGRLCRTVSWHTSQGGDGTGSPRWARSTGLRHARALLCRRAIGLLLVPSVRVERTCPCGHRFLRPARRPVPPRGGLLLVHRQWLAQRARSARSPDMPA
jgi:hypothetical protein